MDVFDLFASLSLDTSDYSEGLNDASSSAKDFGSGFSDVCAGVVGLVGGVAGAVATVTTAVVTAVGEVGALGDEISKSAQKLGISNDAYQEWSFVLEHSGTSIGTMTGAMRTLSNAIVNQSDESVEAFESIGLSVEELQGLSQEDLFSTVIASLQGMESGTERTALAQKLLGRNAQELAPLLNTSAEETENLKKQVHDLGGVMTEDAINASVDYEDALTNLKAAFTGVKNGAMSDFLPSITTVIDGLTGLFSGDESALAQINEGIDGFISNIDSALPVILDSAISIYEGLLSAVVENLPSLCDTILSSAITLVELILEQAPSIIDAGVSILLEVVDALIEHFPALLDAAVQAIVQIATKLTEPEQLTTLINASIMLITTIYQALIDNLPLLLEAAPVIINNLLVAFSENLDDIILAGIDIMFCLAGALIDNIPLVVDIIPQIIESIYNALCEILEPTVELGGDIIISIMDGLDSKIDEFKEKIRDFNEQAVTTFNSIKTQIEDAGRNIVVGLWNGIDDKVEWLKNKIKGFNDTVLNGIKDFFGIHSPSLLMAEMGGYMAEGIGIGFDSKYETVNNSIKDALDFGGTSAVKSPYIDIYSEGNSFITESIKSLENSLKELNIKFEVVNGNKLSDAIFDSVRVSNAEFTKKNGYSGV